MYTLDTNAIIYYLHGEPKVVSFMEGILKFSQIYISTITKVELFSYPTITDNEAADIDEILSTISIVSLDSRLARIAGSIRSRFRLKLADSVIAATALFTGTKLVTRDIKDFQKVPNLNLHKI